MEEQKHRVALDPGKSNFGFLAGGGAESTDDKMAMDWVGVPNGIAIYAKIASILRGQIATGQLVVGEQLPSIERMSEIYRVAPVTIRLAIRLLVDEGLLNTHRGRGTFVIGGAARTLNVLQDSDAPDDASEATSVKLVKKARLKAVPDDLQLGYRSVGSYEFLRRVYSQGDKMFFIMDAYICDELYETLPKNIDHRLMIPDLLRDEFLARDADVLTTVTVSSADLQIAEILRCDLSFPVAHISRAFIGESNRILVSSKATYRADVFYMQTRQPMKQFLSTRSSSSVRVAD